MQSHATAFPIALLFLAIQPALGLTQTQPTPVLTPAHTRPLLDAPGDGSAWALGETYKLGLSAEGARFAPLLGSRVERPKWLRLGVPELWVGEQRVPTYPGEAEVQGQRLSIDRGWFEERFDCAADSVEHSFLIESKAALPIHGDLVFSLPTSGDLVPAGREQGQRFVLRDGSGELLSTVTYGDWLARDAQGREVRGQTGFSDGALTISVPAEFWQTAAFPLLVDPILSVFSVDANSFANETDSDVSYDVTNDVWLVVYTDSGNDNDDDVLSRRYDGNGTFLEEVAVDIDGEDESSPRVANNNKNNLFLVVWAREQDFVNTDRIQGRRRSAGSTAQGSTFNVSSGVNEITPDVGGASDVTSDKWLVVWQELNITNTRRSILAVGVDQNDGISAIQEVSVSSSLIPGQINSSMRPTVSSTAGPFNNWVVTWGAEESFNSYRLRARLVSNPALAMSNELLITNAAQALDPQPSVAGDGKNFLVVGATTTNGGDLTGYRLQLAGNLVLVGAPINLSAQLEGPNLNLPQTEPSISGNGCRYTLAYTQGATGVGNFDVRCASVLISDTGTVTVTDVPTSVQVTPEPDRLPAIASQFDGGGSSLKSFGAWTRQATSTNLNLNGFRFDTAAQGTVVEIPTGCGGLFIEPGLLLSGPVEVGSSFTLSLNTGLGGSGAPLMLIGEPTNLPLCPGQASCALGVGLTYLTLPTNSAALAIPCKSGFFGAQFAMQGAVLGISGGGACGAPAFPIAFRVTDTLVVTVR